MNSNNTLLLRAGAFFVVYLAFTALFQFTPLKHALSAYVCGIGNTFNSTYYNGGEVKFRQIVDEERKGPRLEEYRGFDVLVTLKSEKQKQIAIEKAKKQGLSQAQITPIQYADSSWNLLGIILSFYLALLIVTPVSIKRKLIASIIGIIVLSLLVATKFWFSLGTKYATYYERFQAGFEGDFAITIVNRLHLLIDFMGFGLLMACLLWLALCGSKIIKIGE